MNAEKEKAILETARRNPFWVCVFVFLLLACDHGFGLANLVQQRQRLNQAELYQTQNFNTLTQAKQLEARLEALSFELIQIAKTNTAAQQIIQDFNIQWHPNPAANLDATAATPASAAPATAAPAPAPAAK